MPRLIISMKLLLVLCWFPISSTAQSIEDANAAADAGKYEIALPIWRTLAARGNTQAQANLGALLIIGLGADQDIDDGLHWLCLAAYQNDPHAQLSLGTYLSEGPEARRNFEAAAYWYRLASQQGDAIARVSLKALLDAGKASPYATNPSQKVCNTGPVSFDIASLFMPPYWVNTDEIEPTIEPFGPMFDVRPLEVFAWGGKTPAKVKVLDLETNTISMVDNSGHFTFEPEISLVANGTTLCRFQRYTVTFPEFDGNPLRRILNSQLFMADRGVKALHYLLGEDFQLVEYIGALGAANIWVWSWVNSDTPLVVHGMVLRKLERDGDTCGTARMLASLELNHPHGQNWKPTTDANTNDTSMINASGTVISIDLKHLSRNGLSNARFIAELRAHIDGFNFAKTTEFNPQFNAPNERIVTLRDLAEVHPIGARTDKENPWHRVFLELVHDCNWGPETMPLLNAAIEYGFSPRSRCD